MVICGVCQGRAEHEHAGDCGLARAEKRIAELEDERDEARAQCDSVRQMHARILAHPPEDVERAYSVILQTAPRNETGKRIVQAVDSLRWDASQRKAELDAALAEVATLKTSLSEAIGTMRIFRGSAGWQEYYDHSPEMKRWRAALGDKAVVEKESTT